MSSTTTSYVSVDPDEDFDDAADWLSTNPAMATLANAVKLEIYGCYKVATVGPQPDGSSPGFFSGPAVKAKYNAWQSAGQRYGEDASAAKTRYIEIAYDIGWRPDSDSAGEDQVKGKKTGLGGVRVSAMSPDDQAEDGETLNQPLHAAAEKGDLEKVKEVIGENSASLNEQDEFGMTALHVASDRGHVEVVRWLVAQGADVKLEEQDGMTPFALAEISGRKDVMKVLS